MVVVLGPPPTVATPGAVPTGRPLARQAAEWRVYVPFYARALALQGSHPTVAASLVQHSSVFEDPLGRVVRTTGYATQMLYGDDPLATGAELRRLHRGIAGVDFDGRRYHAWDRDLWTWVHCTTVAAHLYGMAVSCGPLDEEEVAAYYADSRRTGERYGVRRRDMPADVAGLRSYVDEGIATRLRPNPGTERLRQALLAGDVLGRRLPLRGPARHATERVAAVPLRVLVFGAFPAPVRHLWRVRWSSLDERAYGGALLAGRLVGAVLPDRLRLLPSARRALRGA